MKIFDNGDVQFSIYQDSISECRHLDQCVFTKYECPHGFFYVTTGEDCANHIYFRGRENYSNGFAGRTLSFKMEDGTIEYVQGPWNSNTDSLFTLVGIDYRKMHKTQGIISKQRPNEQYIHRKEDIIHFDENPVTGSFNRIEDLAKKLSKEMGISLYYEKISCGGGSASFVTES